MVKEKLFCKSSFTRSLYSKKKEKKSLLLIERSQETD